MTVTHLPNHGLNTYVTTTGLSLRLKPVRMVVYAKKDIEIRNEFIERGEQIEPPTYSITTAGGEVYTYPLTEALLEVPGDDNQTYQNKLAWAAHLDALQRLVATQAEQRIITMLAMGVREFEVPPLEEWQDELEFMGYEMPDNPLLQKAYYLIYFELNEMDFQAINQQIELLNMGKAVTSERVAFFQDAIQSEMGKRLDQTIARIKEGFEGLDGGKPVHRNDDGEEVGTDAAPVG